MLKKVAYISMIVCLTTMLCSCKKDKNNPEINNSEDIEAYCLENGWGEFSLQNNGDYTSARFEEMPKFIMAFSENGTIRAEYENYYRYSSCKLYSSFNSLLEVTTPPEDGFVHSFTCDNEKFGIERYQHSYNYEFHDNPIYYTKFYIKRIDTHKIKVYYKICDW